MWRAELVRSYTGGISEVLNGDIQYLLGAEGRISAYFSLFYIFFNELKII